jgi:phosphomevalonate kinase
VNVVAPGKLVLTGAYAVLEGAPAIVVAVDRYAVADTAAPDDVDVRALHDAAGRKLGLGSSAAAMVASQAARAVARGEDVGDPVVRATLFRAVRDAHAQSQQGGSGVDVAAAVYGGALRYTVEASARAHDGSAPPPSSPAPDSGASLRAVELPARVELRAFWSGTSARTSDLRARVDALRARSALALSRLRLLAAVAAAAVDAGDARAFVLAARDYGEALDALGRAADAPIVLPSVAGLARSAERSAAAFLPSGAGGGDVAVWLGLAPPPGAFLDRAAALGLAPLALSVDHGGVRVRPPEASP